MKFKFVLTALKGFLHLTDWKLVIDNNHSAIISHDKWLDSYTNSYFNDHHLNIERNIQYGNEAAVYFSLLLHPHNLSEGRLTAILKLLKVGKTIYINRNGGYSTSELYDIMDTVEKDTLDFPIDEIEYITISKYPAGKHWYLSSNIPGRIFDIPKFNTYKDAHKAALKITSNISTKE